MTQTNTTQNKEELKLTELTENQYKILSKMSSEYCYPYKWFDDTGLDLDTLRAEMKLLRELGVVEYQRGLINDDGEVVGSGHGISYKYSSLVTDLINNYEEKNTEKWERDFDKLASIKHSSNIWSTLEVKEFIKKTRLQAHQSGIEEGGNKERKRIASVVKKILIEVPNCETCTKAELIDIFNKAMEE